MSRQEDLQKQIAQHQRRLQLLKERQARQGINTDPVVITEIEDIKAEIETLQAELAELEKRGEPVYIDIHFGDTEVDPIVSQLNQLFTQYQNRNEVFPISKLLPELRDLILKRNTFVEALPVCGNPSYRFCAACLTDYILDTYWPYARRHAVSKTNKDDKRLLASYEKLLPELQRYCGAMTEMFQPPASPGEVKNLCYSDPDHLEEKINRLQEQLNDKLISTMDVFCEREETKKVCDRCEIHRKRIVEIAESWPIN